MTVAMVASTAETTTVTATFKCVYFGVINVYTKLCSYRRAKAPRMRSNVFVCVCVQVFCIEILYGKHSQTYTHKINGEIHAIKVFYFQILNENSDF